LREDAGAVDDAAALRVFGGKSEFGDPRQRNGGGAHSAGLKANPYLAIIEPGFTETLGCLADGDHLGMGRRVQLVAHGVASLGDDLTLAGDDGANRDLARIRRHGGKVKRAAHRGRQWKAAGQLVALVVAAWLSWTGRRTSTVGTLTVTF
jgi:hypothetical protein